MSLQDAKLILTPNAYKASKLYAVKPTDGTGDATVTRNTTKTRVNSSGLIESIPANVLAPDYLNGVCPALNVESQSTNRVVYSEDLTQTQWVKSNVSVSANAEIAPDGATTADTVTNTPGTVGTIQQVFGTPNDTSIQTTSIFLKKTSIDNFSILRAQYTGGTIITFAVQVNSRNGAFQDIATGLTGSGVNAIEVGVNDFSSDYWRVYLKSQNNASGNTSKNVLFYPSFGTSLGVIAQSDGSATVWGFMDYVGDRVGSYIPTPTNAQVTKNKDMVTIPVPAGTTEIILAFESGVVTTITNIPTTYTVPVARFKYILMR